MRRCAKFSSKMVNRKILLCLVFAVLTVNFIECKGGRGGGRGGHSRSGGSHSWSRGWGSHSSSSNRNSKPSWFSSLFGGSSSSHKYPSSSSGLSGSSGSHSSGSSGSYPSSKSGLSGSGSSNHYYPPSSTGLSGSGTSNGWSSGKHHYPPSTGLSGKGSSSGYPSSGYSGSGYSSGKKYYPSSSYSGSNYGNNGHYNPPTYYSVPQHVYVTEYKNSGSRYSDLLTGLTLYNLGRSHSHYRDHYYNDDYYNKRYSSGNSDHFYDAPQETATCRLKIKDHDSVETVKIPCEIVSTFQVNSKTVTAKSTENTTVCVTKTMVVNDTTSSNDATTTKLGLNTVDNATFLEQPLNVFNTINNTTVNETIILPIIPKDTKSADAEAALRTHVVNVTTCTAAMNSTDPLTVKGPAVDASGKECVVEIQTKESLFSNKIDCSKLLNYAKMPKPKKDESSLMPSRGTLKSWSSNPPWWMSLFIAV